MKMKNDQFIAQDIKKKIWLVLKIKINAYIRIVRSDHHTIMKEKKYAFIVIYIN
jgi:transketolase C-terminal domain/subunit